MRDGYILNTPEVEVDTASSSCCWRLWGSRVVDVFFLTAIYICENSVELNARQMNYNRIRSVGKVNLIVTCH